jgi:hypothetical protein
MSSASLALLFLGVALGWIVLLGGAVLLLRRFFGDRSGGRGGGGEQRYLCDDCRYDYDAACRRSERPNATDCPEYQKR